MKLDISSQGVPLEGTVTSHIQKCLGTDLERLLTHFDDSIKQAKVHVEKRTRYGYKVSFEMQLPGKRIFSNEKHEDFHLAVTSLRDEVKRQIKRHKDKIQDKTM